VGQKTVQLFIRSKISFVIIRPCIPDI